MLDFVVTPEAREWMRQARHKATVARNTWLFAKSAGLRKGACICGATKVHMHHPDYEKPFEVGFLCAGCHRKEHHNTLGKQFEVHDLRWLAVEHQVAFA